MTYYNLGKSGYPFSAIRAFAYALGALLLVGYNGEFGASSIRNQLETSISWGATSFDFAADTSFA